MQVCADKVDQALGDKLLGNFLFRFAICAGKAEQVDLKLEAAVVQGLVALGAVVVIRVTLGVRQYGFDAFYLEVEDQLVEVPRFL